MANRRYGSHGRFSLSSFRCKRKRMVPDGREMNMLIQEGKRNEKQP